MCVQGCLGAVLCSQGLSGPCEWERVCVPILPHGRLVMGQNGQNMKEEPINSFLPCADSGRAL